MDNYSELQLGRKEDFVYSDFLLIKKMKQGDDAAFDIFIRKYYRKILIYCYYHCPDKDKSYDGNGLGMFCGKKHGI